MGHLRSDNRISAKPSHASAVERVKKDDESSFPNRVRVLLILVFFLGVAAIGRLYFLQVSEHGKWKGMADGQQMLSAEVFPDRGEILFREGDGIYPAAVNREYPTLYVVPKEVDDPAKTAFALSSITGIPEEEIRSKLNDRNDPFEIIKKRLSDDELAKIRDVGARGVRILNEKNRFYPAKGLASQVVGFVSPKDDGRGEIGRYGLESSLDDLLSGKPGKIFQTRDAGGRWIPTSDREMVPSHKGPDVVLSIDHVIQHEVENILRESLEKHQADAATAIVMEPTTGKVLAMASAPSFDPNEYAKTEEYSLFLNPAVSQVYEPGSIMKPITMAIGIEEGKVSPDTEFTDPCSVVEAGYTIRNAEDKCYGRSDMRKVLEESINTGVIFVEKLVGNRRFTEYFDRFGFGRKTDIELPAELPGNTRNLDNAKKNLEFFTASFGQGISTTPLQMISAYQALANGGILMRPSVVDRYVYSDGHEEKSEPVEVRRVVSKETADSLGEMLEGVVLRGHGKRAAVSGYRVGGKTGTAQVAKKGEKGYDDGLTIGSFVGYAPIGDPKFVVLAKIDNPKDVVWAESSAAPVFGEIMKFLLSYGKVEPTEKISGNQPVRNDTSSPAEIRDAKPIKNE